MDINDSNNKIKKMSHSDKLVRGRVFGEAKLKDAQNIIDLLSNLLAVSLTQLIKTLHGGL